MMTQLWSGIPQELLDLPLFHHHWNWLESMKEIPTTYYYPRFNWIVHDGGYGDAQVIYLTYHLWLPCNEW